MNGSATSCSVTAMAAARMLQRVSQAKKIESSVFRPTNGVKPKKIPMATPPAMAFGVSRIASSFSECSLSHLRRFIGQRNPVQYYQSARTDQSAASFVCIYRHDEVVRSAQPEGLPDCSPGQGWGKD